MRGYEFAQTIALSGADFAQAATNFVQTYFDPEIAIGYDEARDDYVASQDPVYRFTAPARLRYFTQGLAHRGKVLAHEYLLDDIAFEDGDHIVESGGNDGDFSLALRQFGKRFSLDTFEPSPREFQTLSANIASLGIYEQARAHDVALWHQSDQELEFYVKSGTADSSIHPIDGSSEVVKVRTKRLDEVLPRQRYKLLKLEAEGAEPEILDGAMGVLDCFDYVTADVGFERGLKQESTLPQVTNLLLRNGFSVARCGNERRVVLYVNDRTSA
ncbi:FkbM family methyltransferase [Yoonia sp. R2331]|uniref:FkbM family methyltransferase n=1 Tax=Yoonia sp. R2331 TaxID=3237238 RepID=UPI0034E3EF6F